jgi:hypothetical protein
MPWVCPHCQSPDVGAFYNERRFALLDQTHVLTPEPEYNNSVLVEVDMKKRVVCCRNCDALGITPVRRDAASTSAQGATED